MKRKALYAAAAGIFVATAAYAAMDGGGGHDMMHSMMGGHGGPSTDERVELKIPAPMKVMQKKMMRAHLDTVSEITAAVAEGDLERAAKVAREKLGWNDVEAKRCSMVEKMTGEKGFMEYGMAVHKKADELADAAEAGDTHKTLVHLAGLIKNCNSCHETYRH